MPETDATESKNPSEGCIKSQFAKFLCSGGASAAVDLGLYSLIVTLTSLHPLIANPISRVCGGITSFLLNRHWTFGRTSAKDLHVHLLKFAAAWIGAFLLSESLIWVFHSALTIQPILAKVMAEGITGIAVFFAHRHWTYR